MNLSSSFSNSEACSNIPSEQIEVSNLCCNPDVPVVNENGDEYVHRLVQDENAKTILLNVPLDMNPTGSGKFYVNSTIGRFNSS